MKRFVLVVSLMIVTGLFAFGISSSVVTQQRTGSDLLTVSSDVFVSPAYAQKKHACNKTCSSDAECNSGQRCVLGCCKHLKKKH